MIILSSSPSHVIHSKDARVELWSAKKLCSGSSFPAVTTLLTLLIFYIEKMIENIVTNGFDGVLKTLPSLLLFGLVFKLLVSVVSKGVILFPHLEIQGQLLQFILGSQSSNGLRQILGLKLNMASQKQRGCFTSPNTELLATAQHLETLCSWGWFGTGVQ